MVQTNMKMSPTSISPLQTRVREFTQSEGDSAPGRVPRQQSIASASQLPASSSRQASAQVASTRYVKQHQALMERQRQVHEEERALWHTERKELHEKIAELEGSLRRYQAISSSQVLSPIGRNESQEIASFWGLLSTDGSRTTSASFTGDEVWRGTKPDVLPTRTFSDVSNQSARPDSRLPSIAEDTTSNARRESSRDSTGLRPLKHKPSINGVHVDKNLDGINFKSGGLPPDIVKEAMTPQSISPQSPSPTRESPCTLPMRLLKPRAPEDLYTKDAGHTPLPRRTYFNNDNASDTSTPKQSDEQPEVERPPLEPRNTSVKLPSERSDSYFPAPPDPSEEEDPELKAPLGLRNNEGNDNRFLVELDSKLLQAARSDTSESPSVAGASDSHDGNTVNDERENDFEQSEHEPKLRIKMSMNFGSAFGSKDCGKGF